MTSPAPRPSDSDPSKPKRSGDYGYIKDFYRSDEVAADYDRHRFATPERARRNRRKWAAIVRALDRCGIVRDVLDLPCGTGRFTSSLARRDATVVGADISAPMMKVARQQCSGEPRVAGFVEADAEKLPFGDASFDAVVSIRFMMHVDAPVRVRILREMARVTRRWLIIDYRHVYSARWASWRLRRALGLTSTVLRRVTRGEVRRELADGGFEALAIIPVTRLFSDKWIVLARKAS